MFSVYVDNQDSISNYLVYSILDLPAFYFISFLRIICDLSGRKIIEKSSLKGKRHLSSFFVL